MFSDDTRIGTDISGVKSTMKRLTTNSRFDRAGHPSGFPAVGPSISKTGESTLVRNPLDSIRPNAETQRIGQAMTDATREVRPWMAAHSLPRGWMDTTGAFLRALALLCDDCRNRRTPLSILKLDVDRLDGHGANALPTIRWAVLNWLSDQLHRSTGDTDLLGCLGVNRFVIAQPDTALYQARRTAERLVAAVQHAGPPSFASRRPLSLRVGLVQSSEAFIESEYELLQRARQALEQAGRDGSGRIVIWSDRMPSPGARRREPAVPAADVAQWVRRLQQSLHEARLESTWALVAAVDAKDPYTQAHSITVANYAEAIGKRMGLARSALDTLRAASLLHDVGKIGVPDSILTKPDRLTEEEFAIIKRHPETALTILGHMSFLDEERSLILYHHERFDGRGYPHGLAAGHIPLGARIVAVADATDTMLSARSYKAPYPIERVSAELRQGSGTQFDPDVVAAALTWLHEEAPTLRSGHR